MLGKRPHSFAFLVKLALFKLYHPRAFSNSTSHFGNVYGIGGLFHYVNVLSAYQSGFITTDASIHSLKLSHTGSIGATFSAAESLTIGYVPAEGAFALLGLTSVVSRRRRS